jgi:hypothetical protein
MTELRPRLHEHLIGSAQASCRVPPRLLVSAPTSAPHNANEVGSDPPAVREHGRHALHELPHLAGEVRLPLPIEHTDDPKPTGDNRLSRFRQLRVPRITNRS